MIRQPVKERGDWKETALAHGFSFHSIEGDPYWDESAYYQFTLRQIEEDLEAAAQELEGFCFEVVQRVLNDSQFMKKLKIPEPFWDYVTASWNNQQRNLYGRMDFSYSGNGPAKLLEYNADTPTTLYESSIFQWVWLEQAVERGLIPNGADQFNSIHEELLEAFPKLGISGTLHLTTAADSEEDKGTVEYLEDCARQAGLDTSLMLIEDVGVNAAGQFTDLADEPIYSLFKLYPWEWLMAEEFAQQIPGSGTYFIEPAWKTILSNKGLLPILWEMFEGHPNLLPAYFEGDPRAADLGDTYVRKPLFSREGQNLSIVENGETKFDRPGPYGTEGYVLQAYHPLPEFSGNFPMLGCWLIASKAAGMCMREDVIPITTDDSRFIPHIILD